MVSPRTGENGIRRRLQRPGASALGVAVAALGVVALQAWAIRAQSFTHDEPCHLLAGYQALRYGTNTLNLGHPPLVKLVAALPLLAAEKPLAPAAAVEDAYEAEVALFTIPGFVGVWRLATKTITAVFFGGLLLWGCCLLGREVGGRAAGLALVLLVGLSFALFPHFSVVQTDVAATAGFVLTLAAALRFVRDPSMGRALATGSALGLALACKFSGVLLIPTVLLALALAALAARGRRPLRRLAGAACVVAAAALAVPAFAYAAANLRYDRARGEATLRAYCAGRSTCELRSTTLVGDRLRPWEETLLEMARWTPGGAQWLTGLLSVRAHNALAIYSFVSFGEMRSRGRWWYHPALFLIKTPLAILFSIAAALLVRLRRGGSIWHTAFRREGAGAGWLIGVTVGLYLAAALSSNYNIGSRHLMPVIPFLYLPAALWLGESRRRTLAAAAVLLAESAAMGPFWIQATNTWWLGGLNPSRFASITGDYEWKQNFIALAAEARRRKIERLHVVTTATDPREIAAYLPGGDTRVPGDAVGPGWYAVSLAVEQSLAAFAKASPRDLNDYPGMLKAAGRWRALVDEIERGEDQGVAGGTFRLVRVRSPERPPGAAR